MNNNDLTHAQSPEDTTNVIEKKFSNVKWIGIYGLRNKITDKWYVGQSVDIKLRWNKYKNATCKTQPKLYRALKKYGYNAFDKYIIELCNPNTTDEMLNKKETAWIRHHNSCNNGYNCTEDGTIRLLVRTTEHNRKIGEANKGKTSWSKGRRLSEEHKANLRKPHKNKRPPFSEEYRKKMSETMKRIRQAQPCGEP